MFDTEPLYYQVGTELLGRRGHQFSMRMQQKMMGRPGPDAMTLLIDSFELTDSWQSLLSESDEIFAGKISGELAAMPGLFEFLDLLESQGLPFGVATSSKRQFAEVMLDKFKIRERLAFLLTGDDVTNGKPHPEMYLTAAAQHELDPKHMMVLEDSENGCKAAIASGACAIGVPGEHSKDHDFTGAAMVANSLADPVLCGLIDPRL